MSQNMYKCGIQRQTGNSKVPLLFLELVMHDLRYNRQV